MTLHELLEQLKGTENENLIPKINQAVNGIKAKAIKQFEETNTKLEDEIAGLKTKLHGNVMDKVLNNLVGDNNEAKEILKKITDIQDDFDEKKIIKKYKSNIEKYKNVLNLQQNETNEEEQKEHSYDKSIEEHGFEKDFMFKEKKQNSNSKTLDDTILEHVG